MTLMQKPAIAQMAKLALTAALAVSLAGCSLYDYRNHSDRVAYSAGDAVKANLERETTDPSKKSMNKLTGLGKDGSQVPPSETPPPI